MIIEETYEVIHAKYGQRLNTVTIEKLVAGVYLTAVKLSSGYSGLASNDLNSSDNCTHSRNRGFGDFTPGNFKGQKVADLFELSEPTCFIKTLQLAVMNALSAELMEDSTYRIIENLDPMELIDLSQKKQVCVIGAFLSYIKKIAESNSDLKIIELNENAIPEEYRQYYVPPDLAQDVIVKSDIIIITGASLANHTLDNLLEFIPAETKVILVGPTSGLLPDVLFARGVYIIGATRITDSAKMLELVAEGAAGFHLFNYCATKICIVNES
ncbi:MAG: DUF364 domain-containing protein [Bacteroidales bacterium]|nr:DUF364 domain-containing protein [Bacteroidales bacterium]